MTAPRNEFHTLPLPVAQVALPLYRERTLAMLRRYFCLAIETGRLPSLLGREFFRARNSSYRLHTFEDAVIFVHDVERCLERLDPISQKLIAHITLQGHTAEETARRMNWTRRHVVRCYPDALDNLSAILLRVRLLEPDFDMSEPACELKKPMVRVMACQEPEIGGFAVIA
jgi:hypothetical protein